MSDHPPEKNTLVDVDESISMSSMSAWAALHTIASSQFDHVWSRSLFSPLGTVRDMCLLDKSWNQENPAKLPEMLECSHESQHHLKSCPSVKRLGNQENFGDFDIWCWSSWASSFTYHLAYLCMLYMTQICTWYMSCRLHIRTSLFIYVYIIYIYTYNLSICIIHISVTTWHI